jgi:hypothetical protein
LIKQLVKYINSFGSHSWGSELFEKQKDSVQSMRFPCVSWLLAVSKTGRYPNQNSFYLWFLTIKNMSGRNFSIDGFSTFFFSPCISTVGPEASRLSQELAAEAWPKSSMGTWPVLTHIYRRRGGSFLPAGSVQGRVSSAMEFGGLFQQENWQNDGIHHDIS